MFGKPRRNSNKEFSNLDLLEFDPSPSSLTEQLTKAPRISPMHSPILPPEVTAFRLGEYPTDPSLLRDMTVGHLVFYIPDEDIELSGRLSDIE
ncbi:MAG: hypothetical protein AAF673_01080 [Pseudomonadota bacterium]